MFIGHRTTKHEKKVVRIVFIQVKKKSENGSNFVTQKYFFPKAIAC